MRYSLLAAALAVAEPLLREMGWMANRVQSLSEGQERLAGDGKTAFQTPFATLHAFEGFADLFLTTPNQGVRDNALEISLPVKSTKLALSYHQYDSDAGSQQLGSEVNATLAWDPAPNLNLLVKLAQYNADSHAVDTTKVWFMASFNL